MIQIKVEKLPGNNMGSRHLQGTVFARVKALLASGTLKKKPLWYDVMDAFPPLVESKLTDIPNDGRPPVITFKEDELRDLFYERFPLLRKIPLNCLDNNGENNGNTLSLNEKSKFSSKAKYLPTIDSIICKYKKNIGMKNNHEAAFNKTVDWLLNEEQLAKMKASWAKDVQAIRKKNEGINENKTDINEDINVMDLFNLKLNKDK